MYFCRINQDTKSIMGKQIATFKDYDIFMADKTSLLEIAQFMVRENYSHHISSFTEKEVNEDIKSVLEEDEILYDNKSHIYIARDAFGNIVGCIRSFHWDKHKTLLIEKIYGINPLNTIHWESKYSFGTSDALPLQRI